MTMFANEQRLIAAFAKMREAREEIHAIVAEAEAQAYEWFESEAYHRAHPDTVVARAAETVSPAAENTPIAEQAVSHVVSAPEPVPALQAQPEPEPEPEPVMEQPSLEDVRAALMAAQRAGHREKIKTLLVGFGATKLSSLNPKHYQAALDEVKGW